MAFLVGPRQSGKTTTATTFQSKQTSYWTWDDSDDRLLLRSSPANFLKTVVERDPDKKLLVLDEIHKGTKWRGWLKGFYDKHHDQYQFIVTGSARLNIFSRGGDSLLGRYFFYRHHPFSLGELEKAEFKNKLFRSPVRRKGNKLQTLLRFGGFPRPFLTARVSSHRKWVRMRKDLLLREDLRDLSKVEDIAAIELLVQLLLPRVGQLLNYQNLANDLDVSVDSIRRWVRLLNHLYYTYLVLPYTKQIKRSIKKMPKVYLWDWSEVPDEAARFENLIASHLLKSVHYWTDCGYGDFSLYYIRDKEKREVDFLVTKDSTPFLLAECKTSDENPSPTLRHFSNLLKPPYVYHVVLNKKATGKGILELGSGGVISAVDFCQSLV